MSKVVNGHFKVHMSDTGVRMCMYGDDVALAILSNDLTYIIRLITENVLLSVSSKALVLQSTVPRTKARIMEFDSVINLRREVVVLEVKSDKSREYRSLG